jgi:hypothetical protein
MTRPAEKKRAATNTIWRLRPFIWSVVIPEKFLKKIIEPGPEAEDGPA